MKNSTLCSNIGRMSAGHIMSTVFSLSVCVFPAPFAFAQGEQIAEQVTGTLLKQITGMDVGSIELGVGSDFTITRRDGSRYVFENVLRDKSGAASATVYVYDSNETLMDTVAFHRGIQVVDDNRIDLEAQITPAGEKDPSTISVSLTGLKSKVYTAVGSISEGGESRAFMVDYSGVNDSTGSTDLSSLVILTSMDGDDAAKLAVLDDLIIIAAVVIFVLATCMIFGWWGC